MNQFKVCDKVKYKEDEKDSAITNGHEADQIYTIHYLKNDSAFFEGCADCCWIERLELVNNRHKHADLMIACANDTTLEIQWRSDPDQKWSDLSQQPSWYPDFEYRIKPKTVTKYQVLYLMTEYNQANVTSNYFFDEEDFNSAGYTKAKFISMIKETAKEFQI